MWHLWGTVVVFSTAVYRTRPTQSCERNHCRAALHKQWGPHTAGCIVWIIYGTEWNKSCSFCKKRKIKNRTFFFFLFWIWAHRVNPASWDWRESTGNSSRSPGASWEACTLRQWLQGPVSAVRLTLNGEWTSYFVLHSLHRVLLKSSLKYHWSLVGSIITFCLEWPSAGITYRSKKKEICLKYHYMCSATQNLFDRRAQLK